MTNELYQTSHPTTKQSIFSLGFIAGVEESSIGHEIVESGNFIPDFVFPRFESIHNMFFTRDCIYFRRSLIISEKHTVYEKFEKSANLRSKSST